MEIHRELESILWQINNELPQEDRIGPEEIGHVGHQLNDMLNNVTQEARQQHYLPTHPRTWREKLSALWEAIKTKINEWLCPVSSRWQRFLEAMKTKLQELQSRPGGEALIGVGLMAVGIALVAALAKSIPLLIGLLAALGFVTLLRLVERITRIPCCY